MKKNKEFQNFQNGPVRRRIYKNFQGIRQLDRKYGAVLLQRNEPPCKNAENIRSAIGLQQHLWSYRSFW